MRGDACSRCASSTHLSTVRRNSDGDRTIFLYGAPTNCATVSSAIRLSKDRFSTAFGGTPTVQLTGTADLHLGNGNPAVVDADANGFRYSLDVGGGRTRNFSGRWIAVGPSISAPPPSPPPPPLSNSTTVIQKQVVLQDYCIEENISACARGKFWEIKASCPPTTKVQSVSCSLNNFSYGPALIDNAANADGSSGICVWGTQRKPDVSTKGNILVVCGK